MKTILISFIFFSQLAFAGKIRVEDRENGKAETVTLTGYQVTSGYSSLDAFYAVALAGDIMVDVKLKTVQEAEWLINQLKAGRKMQCKVSNVIPSTRYSCDAFVIEF